MWKRENNPVTSSLASTPLPTVPCFQRTREVECNTTEQKKRKPVWEWDRSPSPILAGSPIKTNADIRVSFGIKTNVYIFDWGLNDWGVSVPKSPLPYFFRFPSMSLWRQTRVWKTRISLSDHWALKIHWQWAYLQTVSATVRTLRTAPTHSAWTGEESYAAFASKLCIKAQYQIFSPHDYHGPRIHKKKPKTKSYQTNMSLTLFNLCFVSFFLANKERKRETL